MLFNFYLGYFKSLLWHVLPCFVYILYDYKNEWKMGMIDDRKKFKRSKEQTNPTNLTGNINQKTNDLDIDKSTIKKQQNKK